MIEHKRADDKGWLCWVAMRVSQTWDWVDERDIDKHIAAWWTFYMTYYILEWCLNFVWVYPNKPGLETAAIIGAILLPWTPLQAAVVKWYFEARKDT